MEDNLISTTDLSKFFGLNIPSKFLKELGFNPKFETKTAIVWDKNDLPKMAMRLATHFLIIGGAIND